MIGFLNGGDRKGRSETKRLSDLREPEWAAGQLGAGKHISITDRAHVSTRVPGTSLATGQP